MNGTIVFEEVGKGKELVQPHRLRKREPPNAWGVAKQRFVDSRVASKTFVLVSSGRYQ
jgi:hypothetical protein